jgi:hypothetical protein
MLLTAIFVAVLAYGALLIGLWGWGIVHAYSTPKEAWSRRALWVLALVVNPFATMWYWYIWRRWAFWILFAPAIAFLTFIRPVLESVIRAFAVRDIADRFVVLATIFLESVLDVIPLPILLPLIVFPFLHRLAALAHLGGNSDLRAPDRNDMAISFALPLVGFGAAMAYCFKWRRGWALAGLMWFVLFAAVTGVFVSKVGMN